MTHLMTFSDFMSLQFGSPQLTINHPNQHNPWMLSGLSIGYGIGLMPVIILIGGIVAFGGVSTTYADGKYFFLAKTGIREVVPWVWWIMFILSRFAIMGGVLAVICGGGSAIIGRRCPARHLPRPNYAKSIAPLMYGAVIASVAMFITGIVMLFLYPNWQFLD